MGMNPITAPAAQPEQEKLVGYDEVAAALGISARTVYEQMRRNKIPYFKFGRSVRFRLSDVRAKIETTCHVAARPARR
jgi:excisionase family DNA binding protein